MGFCRCLPGQTVPGEAPLKKSRAARWMDPNVRAGPAGDGTYLGHAGEDQGSEWEGRIVMSMRRWMIMNGW